MASVSWKNVEPDKVLATVLLWDWKDTVDHQELNACIHRGLTYFHGVETSQDAYALIVSSHPLTDAQAQTVFDHIEEIWAEDGDPFENGDMDVTALVGPIVAQRNKRGEIVPPRTRRRRASKQGTLQLQIYASLIQHTYAR